MYGSAFWQHNFRYSIEIVFFLINILKNMNLN